MTFNWQKLPEASCGKHCGFYWVILENENSYEGFYARFPIVTGQKMLNDHYFAKHSYQLPEDKRSVEDLIAAIKEAIEKRFIGIAPVGLLASDETEFPKLP